jgi:hypothetical protein
VLTEVHAVSAYNAVRSDRVGTCRASWATPKAYLDDEIATDQHNPTVNANGPLYGAPEESTDLLPILDPVRHAVSTVKMPVREPKTPSSKQNPMAPSPYWGGEAIWDSQTNRHNPVFDDPKGRYNVRVHDVMYRNTPDVSRPARLYQPEGAGPESDRALGLPKTFVTRQLKRSTAAV